MKPKALVIAEKQLAAETMAKVLHCMEEKDGYFEGEDYIVTWADGHLTGYMYPEEYRPAYKKWKLEDLPLDFSPEKSLKILPGKEKHFEKLKKLIEGPETDRIINAGDAGREGYLIQNRIYQMAGNRKPVELYEELRENLNISDFKKMSFARAAKGKRPAKAGYRKKRRSYAE